MSCFYFIRFNNAIITNTKSFGHLLWIENILFKKSNIYMSKIFLEKNYCTIDVQTFWVHPEGPPTFNSQTMPWNYLATKF